MIGFRGVPLFMRIGLMWWVVLLAWPWSRPFVLFQDPIRSFFQVYAPGFEMPWVGAVALSLLHAIAAGWVIVRCLRLLEVRNTFDNAMTSGFLIAWFAISSWWTVMIAIAATAGALQTGDVLRRLAMVGTSAVSSLAIPLLVTLSFPMAVCLLWPLGIATAWLVRRAERAPDDPRSGTDGRASAG